MSVKITCKDAIENVGYVTYEKRNRKAHDKASEAEIAQMRSVIGSLGDG